MSPEQCRGELNLTHKSDLYSLGVLLYELLTGQRPFRAETTMDMFLQHVNAVPERPSRLTLEIPVWLDNLVCQLLEKRPEHRPFDAAVVAMALNQVAEKVAAQQSAGMEAARARRANRPGGNGALKDTDKAARTLLTSVYRGRRKRRSKPLYERAWFQAAGLSVLLLLIGGAVYLAFQPPSAAKLFAQAQRLMESNNPEQVELARKGPIKDYLQYYGNRSDPQTNQIRQWAERYEVALRELQLRNRLKLPTEDEAERQARQALHSEEDGDWNGAKDRWSQVAKLKANTDSDLRVWGLVAEKRLQELETAAAFETRLLNATEAGAASPGMDLGPPARQAQKTIRYELFGDLAAARANWLELKDKCEKEKEQRVWFLLAAKRLRELSIHMPVATKEEEAKARVQRIKDALDEARKLAAVNRPQEYTRARSICAEILELYHSSPDLRDSPEPSLKPLVEQAKQLHEVLTQGEQKH
jgi:serine/threonine-protein kinase